MTSAPTTRGFTTGGTVDSQRDIYIKRAADDELFRCCQEGNFAYVLTSRQMGKSSLMVSTAHRLRENGDCAAIIDLSEIGSYGAELNSWYGSLLYSLASELNLGLDTFAWWEEHAQLMPAHRFNHFMRNVVLRASDKRIIVFIDE